VAEPGEVEIELASAEYLRDGSTRPLLASAATFNYEIAPGWEAIIESEVAHGFSAGMRASSLVGNGAFLKTVLREGGLQGIALARTALAAWDLINGRLVKPFSIDLPLSNTYWIVCPKAAAMLPKTPGSVTPPFEPWQFPQPYSGRHEPPD
jgi:DNA-binding transcriptional LysR family regulator